MLDVVFCDVLVMQNAKIRHLTSYLMEVKAWAASDLSSRRTVFGDPWSPTPPRPGWWRAPGARSRPRPSRGTLDE